MSFSIIQKIKVVPNLPYEDIKKSILGSSYDLALHFVGEKRAVTINKLTRQKTYAPNVLSFPYTDTIGEIIICPQVASREAADFNMTTDGYIGFLFIHGLLHLKGHDHGKVMETLEKKYIRKFKLV